MNTAKDITAKEKKVFPDGTIFYSYETANQIFGKIERKRFNVSDIILLLLYSHPDKPIFGRILLMKEVFLLTREVLNENEVQDAKYVPYHYGMYSFIVANALNNLEFAGYIERKGKKNSKLEQFRITAKGKQYISEVYSSLPEELQKKLAEKRKGWDQLGYDGILRLVYQKYPEYKEKSRIEKRYKPIDWGRGIG